MLMSIPLSLLSIILSLGVVNAATMVLNVLFFARSAKYAAILSASPNPSLVPLGILQAPVLATICHRVLYT